MANRLFKTPLRALDASGDGISGAKVYLYETGTSTPVTAYTDSGAGTPHPTPLVADGGGTFAELFVSGSAGVKVDLTDASGTSLDGYPVDPVYPESNATTGASNVTFAPTSGVPETDVQAAIEAVDAKVVALEDTQDVVVDVYATAGTTTAYTIAVTDVTAYVSGDRYWIRIDQTNTGAATLNVESSGAKDIYKYDSAGAAAAVVADDLVIGSEYLVHYDGTQFVIISERLARAADSIWESGTATVQYGPSPANIKAAIDTHAPKLMGWEEVETCYDFGVDGSQAIIETAAFADGYEYMLAIELLSADATFNLELYLYRETGAAYTAAANLYSGTTGSGNSMSGEVFIQLPRMSKSTHIAKELIYVTSGAMTDTSTGNIGYEAAAFTHATAQKVGKAKLQPSSGSFDAGVVKLLRRRENVSA